MPKVKMSKKADVKSVINKEENKITLSLNPSIYPLEVVYAACYPFLDRAYLFLDGDPKKEIAVELRGKKEMDGKGLSALAGEFNNELLNCALRNVIATNNKKIREYIIASALFSALPASNKPGKAKSKAVETAAVAPEEESWQEDPLGIAVPWEEKYGKK